MSSSYKEAMDKITLSEEMKKSIINNTSKAAKRKNIRIFYHTYIKRAVGLAACFTVCMMSYYSFTNYTEAPTGVISQIVTTPEPEQHNTSQQEQDNQPIADKTLQTAQDIDAPKTTDTSGFDAKTYTRENIGRYNTKSYQSPNIAAKKTSVQEPISASNNAHEKLPTNLSEYTDIDSSLSKQEENIPVISELPATKNVTEEDNPILSATGNQDGEALQIESDKSLGANHMQNVSDIEQVEQELGYSIKTPGYIPQDYQVQDVCVIADNIAQITYESEKDTISYRTAKGMGDISGDYNTYTDNETISINDSEVTIKGNNDLYYNAGWTDEENSFSVHSDNGIEKETMVDIVESVD